MSQHGVTAADLVNTLTAEELTKIFRDYGEEKFSSNIAKKIEIYLNSKRFNPLKFNF